MARFTCWECEKGIDPFRPTCPHCGSPTSRELFELQVESGAMAGEAAGSIDMLQGCAYGTRTAQWITEFPELMACKAYRRNFESGYEFGWTRTEENTADGNEAETT
ncbi:MAG: hypothetical protein V2B18_22365 [Pseudomonadota bacterium]